MPNPYVIDLPADVELRLREVASTVPWKSPEDLIVDLLSIVLPAKLAGVPDTEIQLRRARLPHRRRQAVRP
jgi:hypothetical protein